MWDVGHQTYPHKILTGRRERMASLRQLGGLAGFPQRAESEYDAFGTAHSSTSISAALGMAVGAKQKGEQRRCIAVIGDGAMSAGMAFEALNNGGVADCDLLVILNDNDMSISPPVGALNRYLAQLMSGRFYAAAKGLGKNVLKVAPPLFELAKRFEEHAKGMVVPATLFEKFGFNYIGPIDGHDLNSLIPTLRRQEAKGRISAMVREGAVQAAEADPVAYKAGQFDPPSAGNRRRCRSRVHQVFGSGWRHAHRTRCRNPRPARVLGELTHQPSRRYTMSASRTHAVTLRRLACGAEAVVAIYPPSCIAPDS